MKAYNIRTGQTYDSNADVEDAPEPLYTSFDDFLEKISRTDIRKWCQSKARKANRSRLLSGPPKYKVTADLVLEVLFKARGRCYYCGSLCVEKAPTVNGKPTPWAHVGRRIGSLTHLVRRVDGGDNTIDNLQWCCHWCNTWPDQRIFGATDHGGIQSIDSHNTNYLIKAIITEIQRVFPDGFNGTYEEYQWLLETYGIDQEEDVCWMRILEYDTDELPEDEQNDQELMAFLHDHSAVNRFLTELLTKYRSGSGYYVR